MSEFFLELFSEEIPASLQKSAREDLLKIFNHLFKEKSIKFKKSSSYSTPNRLVLLFEGISSLNNSKKNSDIIFDYLTKPLLQIL